MKLEHLRALSILVGSPYGCTEATIIAQGFTIGSVVELIKAGLATVTTERMIAGRKPVNVTRVRITKAGQQLYQGGLPGGLRGPPADG
jgi:hypothetical protein